MNAHARLLSIILFLMFHLPLRSELLILKQTEHGCFPLDESDNPNKAIIKEILLQYQWPASAAFALDPIDVRRKVLNETDDLFTPDKPNAEEIWIEKKIQQETRNNSYRVIFFPTALYELFVLIKTAETQIDTPHPLQEPLHTAIKAEYKALNLTPIIESDKLIRTIRQEIKHCYTKANRPFFQGPNSVYDYINQQLIIWLFKIYPDLATSTPAVALSDAIANKSNEITRHLLAAFRALEIKKSIFMPTALPIQEELNNDVYNYILSTVITLEYEARQSNKALLIRGTSFKKFEFFKDDAPTSKFLAGSTLPLQDRNEKNVTSIGYTESMNSPYSISFGNSLFAGSTHDLTACVYYYLVTRTTQYNHLLEAAGYALLLNKNEYIEHNNANLFFIASLSSLAALFQEGEYFHPRTKVAFALKNNYPKKIAGLGQNLYKDRASILLVTRNPYKHASLFSQFIADNGRMIQIGDEATLTDPEKKCIQDVIETQNTAAKYYKAIPTIKDAPRKLRSSRLQAIIKEKKAIKQQNFPKEEREKKLNVLREEEKRLKNLCKNEKTCTIQ